MVSVPRCDSFVPDDHSALFKKNRSKHLEAWVIVIISPLGYAQHSTLVCTSFWSWLWVCSELTRNYVHLRHRSTALVIQKCPNSVCKILMHFPSDMSCIVPEIFLDWQASISCIVGGYIRSVISETIPSCVLDSIWSRVIQDTGQESVGIEDHCFGARMRSLERTSRGIDDGVVLMHHSAVGQWCCAHNVSRLTIVSKQCGASREREVREGMIV